MDQGVFAVAVVAESSYVYSWAGLWRIQQGVYGAVVFDRVAVELFAWFSSHLNVNLSNVINVLVCVF